MFFQKKTTKQNISVSCLLPDEYNISLRFMDLLIATFCRFSYFFKLIIYILVTVSKDTISYVWADLGEAERCTVVFKVMLQQ